MPDTDPRPSAVRVAECLLWLSAQESVRIPIDPKKLQKLLYYVQGWSLALRGQHAFHDRIKAWGHGPVVPGVWHHFGQGIKKTLSTEGMTCDLPDSDRDFIASVWNDYKKFSGDELERMTHEEEPPYMDVYKPDKFGRCNAVIEATSIERHFRGRVGQELSEEEVERLVENNKPDRSWYDEPLPFPNNG